MRPRESSPLIPQDSTATPSDLAVTCRNSSVVQRPLRIEVVRIGAGGTPVGAELAQVGVHGLSRSDHQLVDEAGIEARHDLGGGAIAGGAGIEHLALAEETMAEVLVDHGVGIGDEVAVAG